MPKYPLEWGWHTDPETNPEPTPAETPPPKTGWPTLLNSVTPIAWGDRKCQAYCSAGGDSGTTGAYVIDGRIHCFKCAIKKLGVENEPPAEQIETLRPRELKGN